jgi:hypothetical protein
MKCNGQETKIARGKKHFVAGSDPILGVSVTPKSLRVSGVAPGHCELASLSPVRFLPRISQGVLVNIRWQLLPEPSGKFCQNSLAVLAIHPAMEETKERSCHAAA